MQSNRRTKWTKEERINVMRAHYIAKKSPAEGIVKDTYSKWREIVGNDVKPNMNANKLANVRRDITNNERLTRTELDEIVASLESSEETYSLSAIEEGNNQATSEAADSNEPLQPDNNSPESPTPDTENNIIIREVQDEIIRQEAILKNIEMSERKRLPKFQMNKKNAKTLSIYNLALENILSGIDDITITELNRWIYSTAYTFSCALDLFPRKAFPSTRKRQQGWKIKMDNSIDQIRKELSILDLVSKGKVVNSRLGKRVKKKYDITKPNKMNKVNEIKEKLKQKLAAKAQRRKRIDQRCKFHWQNQTFCNDASRFYRSLGKPAFETKNTPDMNEITTFWKNIWSKPVNHENCAWIQDDVLKSNATHTSTVVAPEDITKALSKAQKWKAPGMDQVNNFWLYRLKCSHAPLATTFNKIFEQPNITPPWLTSGLTVLIPKCEDTSLPKNFRPITCLSTTYKLLTSIIADSIYLYLEDNNLIPVEQKGCKRGSYGCKDQLLINKMIQEDSHNNNKNLSCAWIDYRKAYDSVPHSWIRKSLELYNIDDRLIQFLIYNMSCWTTTIVINHASGPKKSEPIRIQRGIFQGDSLSPLLFCMALFPLTKLINQQKYGYRCQKATFNHLFYMDDLKLFAKNDEELERLLNIVKSFSDSIKMNFNVSKCAKLTIKRGKYQSSRNITLDQNCSIQELENHQDYKYLGISENAGINHKKMKDKILKEYCRRLRSILVSQLNSKNKFIAINSLAVPVLLYSFGIVNWTMAEIKRIDTKTRKILTRHKGHHPKADVERLYLKRSDGGRGLLQAEMSYKLSLIGLSTYLASTNDWTMKCVEAHETSKKLYSITNKGKEYKKDFERENKDKHDTIRDDATKKAKRTKEFAKKYFLSEMKRTWEQKPLHGKFPERAQHADVDQIKTFSWLKSSTLKIETEGFIVAAQDQCLKTKNYIKHIMKTGQDAMCRFCNDNQETIDHLISGCSTLAKKEYITRHNKVAQYVHWKICRHYGMKVSNAWYNHETAPVAENEQATILWDFPIQTDRTIYANRPDIVVKDKQAKSCLLLDVSIPSDRNTSLKTYEKLSKYKDLDIELAKSWHMKTKTVPIIIGALGVVNKNTPTYLKEVPGNITVDELQKITLLGTSTILRKALSLNAI